MQNPHLNRAHEIAEALAEGKLVKFPRYVSSESPEAVYELVVSGETFAQLQTRKLEASAELQKQWVPNAEALVFQELINSWAPAAKSETETVRGPVFSVALPGTSEGIAERVFTKGTEDPQQCDAAYVRGIRQVSKTLISGAPKVTKSAPKTLLKQAIIDRYLDKGHPGIFQLKVTADTAFEVLPQPVDKS
jgi:hypothetical protein